MVEFDNAKMELVGRIHTTSLLYKWLVVFWYRIRGFVVSVERNREWGGWNIDVYKRR